eukprot:3925560-Amphidinium_carterae.1
MQIVDEKGQRVEATFYVVNDENTPVIVAVSDMTRDGKWKMEADEHGGLFRNTENEKELHFKMNRGIYEMNAWISSNDDCTVTDTTERVCGLEVLLDESAGAGGLFGDHSASAEHELAGHQPHRSWCRECIRGRGRAQGHPTNNTKKSTTPKLSIDFMFLGRGDGQMLTILCAHDASTQRIMGTVVPSKESHPYTVAWLHQQIRIT